MPSIDHQMAIVLPRPCRGDEIIEVTKNCIDSRFASGLKRNKPANPSSMSGYFYVVETNEGCQIGVASMFETEHLVVSPLPIVAPFTVDETYTQVYVSGYTWPGVDVYPAYYPDYIRARREMVEEFTRRLDNLFRAMC